MLPENLRDNHTKNEPKTQRWWLEKASQVLDLQFKSGNLGPESAFFAENRHRTCKKGQHKGNSGYSTHAARLPYAEGRTPQYVGEPPAKRPQKPEKLCTLASREPQTKERPYYVAENVISSAPNPPATTHFWCFPRLKITQTDA